MNWTQVLDPLHGIGWSALVASIPILFIFWALVIKKMKGYMASLLTTLVAILVAVLVYGMPVKFAIWSTVQGILFGLFPISWIIIAAVFLYNVTVKSGQFEIIKNFMASITSDRRLQALLVAFSFSAFIESAAGFGAPVAITAAMLVGLGFRPLYAAGICLITNTVPVAYGSIGIVIITAAGVGGLSDMAVSQMVGRTLPFISLLLPFYIVVIMAGFKKAVEVLPAILISAVTYSVILFLASNYINPMVTGIMAGLASVVSLAIFLKYWKPKTVWRFKEEPEQTINTELKYTTGQIIRAWSPYIIMTLMIVAWGSLPVKNLLNSIGRVQFYLPGLHNTILKPDGTFLDIKPFDFSFLSAAGTATMLSAFLSLPFIGMSFRQSMKVFTATVNQLKLPIITISAIVGFAFVANNSGMSITIAMALASTGVLFPFFSPILGWLGTFLTGSITSSCALFGKLQNSTATAIGVSPVLTVSANISGGAMGKMISPQSIAIGAAAVGLVGRESELLRFTLKHTFILLLIVSIITVIQAYVIPWVIPVSKAIETSASEAIIDHSAGIMYLIILALILATFGLGIYLLNRKKLKVV